MTLRELQRWLTLALAGYHGSVHGSLGQTPAARWAAGVAESGAAGGVTEPGRQAGIVRNDRPDAQHRSHRSEGDTQEPPRPGTTPPAPTRGAAELTDPAAGPGRRRSLPTSVGGGPLYRHRGVVTGESTPRRPGPSAPSAQSLARLPNVERVERFRADRWIGYPRAVEALTRLETLYEWHTKHRMPNLLVVGPTNNGESMIIEEFRRHPPCSGIDAEQIPVLAVLRPLFRSRRRSTVRHAWVGLGGARWAGAVDGQ